MLTTDIRKQCKVTLSARYRQLKFHLVFSYFRLVFSFSGKILHVNMELTQMQRAINRALNGDKKSLALLGVGDHEVVSASKVITPQTFKAEFKHASRQYLAAVQLQLKSLERMAKKYIVHLSWINKHYFKDSALPEVTVVDEDEILEDMAMLSRDLPLTRHSRDISDSEEDDVQMESEVEQMDRDDSETEEEVEEKKRPGLESTRKSAHHPPLSLSHQQHPNDHITRSSAVRCLDANLMVTT